MNILVIAPHADDEILGVGGTIAKYIAEGHNVYICIVTCGHPSMFSHESIKNVKKEAKDSHSFLGIKDTIFLNLPAVLISEVPKYEINEKIYNVLDRINPDIVFIPHFGDMHLDHNIVSQSVMVGARPIKSHKIMEIYSYETLSETEWNIPHMSKAFIPNTYVDISRYLEKKISAMSFYASQLKDFPHPRSLDAIISLAKYRGSTIGVNAAEAFCLIRKIVS